jgi:hypothetical protein
MTDILLDPGNLWDEEAERVAAAIGALGHDVVVERRRPQTKALGWDLLMWAKEYLAPSRGPRRPERRREVGPPSRSIRRPASR